MRLLLRLVLAHVLASALLQVLFLAWMTITGEVFGVIRAVIAVALSSVLMPVVLLGLRYHMRLDRFALFWLLYLAMFAGSFLLLRWRAARAMTRDKI
jgi:hypothetical protein